MGRQQFGPLAHLVTDPCPDLNSSGDCECPGPCSGMCAGACESPFPDLDSASTEVLALFLACQTQWERGGMSERRLGIPRDRVAIEARARGIDLSEFILDKFRACENVLISSDIDRCNRESNKQ